MLVMISAIHLAWAPSAAYAGISAPGFAPSPSCGGKPTTQGTSGDDFAEDSGPSTDVYNMKDGNDEVADNHGGNDVFRMGDGNDEVNSSEGNDTICLGDGNDFALTLDTWIDVVKCGPGDDFVIVDTFDLVDADCENVISFI